MQKAMLERDKTKKAEKAEKAIKPDKAILKKPACRAKPAKKDLDAAQPECPKTHGSINYKAGRIYCNTKHCNFRIIRDVKTPRTERSKVRVAKLPTQEEWQYALDQIDDYWA